MSRFAPILIIIASAAAAENAPVMTVKPIEIIACDSLPSELPFDVKPMMHDPGFKIFYLVEGADLIGFKEGSLVIDRITTADGRDIAKKRNGDAAYKMGSFPKTTEDGKYGIFELTCAENQFGRAESLAIAGSITALTGTKSTSATADLALDAKEPLPLGLYKISSSAGKGLVMGGEGGSTGVTVAGDLDRLIGVTVTDGGKELKRSGWSGSESERTFHFAKASGKALSVTLKWWEDKSERTIAFSHGPEKK